AGALREGVAVHGDLLPHRDLAAHTGVQGGGVVAGPGRLVVQGPRLAQVVQGLHHGRDPHVVVVLADRTRARLLEVREARCARGVERFLRHAFGVLAVTPVAGRVGPRVGTG